MDDVNDLTASIIAEAHTQALAYDEETAQLVTRLRAETDRLVAEKREELYGKAKRRQEELDQQAEAKRQLAATQLILVAKQRAIEDAFTAAAQAVAKMTPTQRKTLIASLWKKATSQIPVATVRAAKPDAAFFKGKCPCVVDNDVKGGFIAQSKDGKLRVDMRFSTLFADAREQKTAEIASILFSTRKTSPTKQPRKTQKGGKR